jgi:hypothetical protein
MTEHLEHERLCTRMPIPGTRGEPPTISSSHRISSHRHQNLHQ